MRDRSWKSPGRTESDHCCNVVGRADIRSRPTMQSFQATLTREIADLEPRKTKQTTCIVEAWRNELIQVCYPSRDQYSQLRNQPHFGLFWRFDGPIKSMEDTGFYW
jgi:hypothetical protein